MGLEPISKYSDAYERKARLYPAFLAFIPVLALAVGAYGISLKINGAIVGSLAALGVFYLIASIAREMGKKIEAELFAEWGGKPTTQILRHSDRTIDSITKARYHSFLGKHLGIVFPSPADEISNPVVADEKYASGALWLLGKTRDTKIFNILFQENISYGFRRNSLGVKPIAIIIAISVCIWTLCLYGVITANGIHISELKEISVGGIGTLVISVIMIFVWFIFFTRAAVKSAAFSYADQLLKACDVLPKKR